jgi:ribosomal protein L15
MPIYRRVPKRGFTNARFRTEYTVVNVEALNSFEDGDVVDLAAIIARGLTSLDTPLLKVLGNGELTTKLTVRAQKFSASAAAKIVAAGGTVVGLDSRGRAPGEARASEKPQAVEPRETQTPETSEGEEAGS